MVTKKEKQKMTKECLNCGKDISDDRDFCNEKCTREYYKNKKNVDSNSIFWLKGEGMNRRNRNIETIKDLIKSGLSYQQIFRKARKYFTFKKFDEYYEIALDEIINPDEESFMDYIKRKEKEKEGKK